MAMQQSGSGRVTAYSEVSGHFFRRSVLCPQVSRFPLAVHWPAKAGRLTRGGHNDGSDRNAQGGSTRPWQHTYHGLECVAILALSNFCFLKEYVMRFRLSRNLLLAIFPFPALCKGEAPNRVTILYDAFGKSAAMTKAWGFSALVEYGGKRILFDTGGSAEILEHNVKALGVDLSKLDFVVISHRHSDHISGLNYLLRVNPTVKIYTAADPWGPFGWAAPNSFYRKEESLPANMRYFDGNPPEMLSASTPWPQANFIQSGFDDGDRAGHFSCANHLAGHWNARTSRNLVGDSRPAGSHHCGWMFSRGRGEDSRSCDQNRSAHPGSIWRHPSCGSA